MSSVAIMHILAWSLQGHVSPDLTALFSISSLLPSQSAALSPSVSVCLPLGDSGVRYCRCNCVFSLCPPALLLVHASPAFRAFLPAPAPFSSCTRPRLCSLCTCLPLRSHPWGGGSGSARLPSRRTPPCRRVAGPTSPMGMRRRAQPSASTSLQNR